MNLSGAWALRDEKFTNNKGTMKDRFALHVDRNWRLTFAFDGQDAILVDYMDYH